MWNSSGDSAVTGVATPPAAGARMIRPLPKMMSPSRFQAPPRTETGASQIVCGRPPAGSIFLSLPPASNAMNRLSGDQKGGVSAPSVPGRGRGSRESIARIQRTRVRPSGPGAMTTTIRPLGDSVNERLPAGRDIWRRATSATSATAAAAATDAGSWERPTDAYTATTSDASATDAQATRSRRHLRLITGDGALD